MEDQLSSARGVGYGVIFGAGVWTGCALIYLIISGIYYFF